MSFVIALAVRDLFMTAEEALLAATAGGAAALRRSDLGRLRPGLRGDAVVLDAPSYTHIPYRPGESLPCMTIVGGEVVYADPGFAR
jgi:imidazolonepropionase